MTVDQLDNFEDVIEKASHLSGSSSLANKGGLPGSAALTEHTQLVHAFSGVAGAVVATVATDATSVEVKHTGTNVTTQAAILKAARAHSRHPPSLKSVKSVESLVDLPRLAESHFFRVGHAAMQFESCFTNNGKLMCTKLKAGTCLPFWGSVIASKVAPKCMKLKFGSGWGFDFWMVPPADGCMMCPAWAVQISNDDADINMDLVIESVELTLFDKETKVKVNRFLLKPLGDAVGKSVALCRKATGDDAKSFVKDVDKLRADMKRKYEDFGIIKKPKVSSTSATPVIEPKSIPKDMKHILG